MIVAGDLRAPTPLWLEADGPDPHSWYSETSELDELDFPEEMLDAARLGTAIGTSHRRRAVL